MKYKLLLFLLVNLLLGNKLQANSLEDRVRTFVTSNNEVSGFLNDSVKKNKKAARVLSSKAQLVSPTTVAGSTCGDGVSFVQVNLYANGSNSSEIIEWFTSQTAATPVFTGNVYSPSIKITRTYYVQSRQGSDVSTRVPVVASVYKSPNLVTMDVSPANSPTDLLCVGTPVTFSAVGGADLFEFSVDGVVAQAMSPNKQYTTSTLTNGQNVSVRTRRAIVLDGSINEDSYGTAPLEDNVLSAPLSNNAEDAYINSVKISAAENRLAIGIAGKLEANRSILLFLDSKTGGFNTANFGDVSDITEVNAFNYFNNNPSTFDSYFQPDYCLIISTDATATNYFANVIELKSGESIKSSLGTASSGSPSSSFAVNKNNTGINDYTVGFEVQMLKSMIGYTTGDLKFFGLTMQATDENNYSVTNSFLSPELNSNLEYGNGSVDYNLKDPNPVVVAAAALIPCYSNANVTMNFYETPVATSVVQPTCQDTFGVVTIANQSGSEYSLDGTTYQTSNTFSGLSPGDYTLYVRNTNDNTCVTTSPSKVTINAVPLPPVVPTASSTTQPTCATPSGTIVISTQSGVEYSVNGTTYQSSNSFAGLAPNNYTLYVRNTADVTCVTMSSSPTTINAVPLPPAAPTESSTVQPTCATPSGTITVSTQSGVEYSVNGTTYQSSNTFSGLALGNYTLYVRNVADPSCVTMSGSTTTINAVPPPPAVPTTASVTQPTCAVPSGSISVTTQTGVEYSLNGTTYQTSNTFSGLAPDNYTLYVKSTSDNTCVTMSPSAITINAVPLPPVVPTASSTTQPTCATPSGTIVISTQSGVEYSVNGTTYQSSNSFAGLAPNNYTLYVRNTADATCVTMSSSPTTINAVPLPPAVPTASSTVQPTCGTPSGTITIATQSGVEYSVNGTTYQSSNTFSGLAPGNYTLYVRNVADPSCVTMSGSTTTINAVPPPPAVPTTASVIQPTCAVPSGSISVTTQTGVEYSLNGTTYQTSNTFSGLAPDNYTLYVKSTSDNTCVTMSPSAITINAVPLPPVVPTASSTTQPTCATPSGTIVISTQSGVEYSVNGTTYQSSNSFAGLAPNNYTLYVRNTADATCVTMSSSPTTINAVPLPPAVPTASSTVQPTCATPSGTITIATQSGVEYSVNGTTYQSSNTFSGLAPGNYTLYVRNVADPSCVTMSGSTTTINAVPPPPAVPTTASVTQPTCAVPSGSISVTTQTGVEYSLNGTTYQTSNTFSGLAPDNYTLYVKSTSDNTCVTMSPSAITINAVPLPPVVPTASSTTQPTCATPSGTIVISTQSGVEYSVNGTTYQSSNSFAGLAPNNYTLYVRNTADATCVTMSSSPTTINAVPLPPAVPTASSTVQPTCATPSGTITIATQSGVEYSVNGTTYQSSNTFSGLAPGDYILYVRKLVDVTCVTQSASPTTINTLPVVLVPTTSSVTQPTCAVPLGRIVISTQAGLEYSLNGTLYQTSNTFSNLPPGNYTLYVRNIVDPSCMAMSASVTTINVVPLPPVVPTASSVTQPSCASPSGTITIATQSGVEYSVNGTTYQTSNSFSGLAPNNYTLYVRNVIDNSCVSQSVLSTTINPLPAVPAVPKLDLLVQPTCLKPSGTVRITAQSNVQYSLGSGYQDSPDFINLAPGNYTLSVRFTNSPACITVGSLLTINPIPPQIQFEINGACEQKDYVLTAIPKSNSYNSNNVSYEWKDKNGNLIGTNSNTLNVSDFVKSNSGTVLFPTTFSLTIKSVSTGCETTDNFTVDGVYCDIQKGISPDGNGANEYFDLKLLDVKKLDIFNRYGMKVYSQANYKDQWKGQSDKGEELPNATYYYVIEFNNGGAKTGWIYLIREKQ